MSSHQGECSANWTIFHESGRSPGGRWGHTAVAFEGQMYVLGGCAAGQHSHNLLRLDMLDKTWSLVACRGHQPGPRDSHTACMVGRSMVVIGGTDGSRKFNEVHSLDIDTLTWTEPMLAGEAPVPRESHSATLLGQHQVLIFGGSSDSEGAYCNDVHVLDLSNMTWSTPAVQGPPPPARDSHTAVALEKFVYVFGGNCQDHYLDDVFKLDTETMTWAQVDVEGPKPGARAGHTSTVIPGTSMFAVIGGVGDSCFYSDVWLLDTDSATWQCIDAKGTVHAARFSHTAVLEGDNILLYGGCGEEESPFGEVLQLQLQLPRAQRSSTDALAGAFSRQRLSVAASYRAATSALQGWHSLPSQLVSPSDSGASRQQRRHQKGLGSPTGSSLSGGEDLLHQPKRQKSSSGPDETENDHLLATADSPPHRRTMEDSSKASLSELDHAAASGQTSLPLSLDESLLLPLGWEQPLLWQRGTQPEQSLPPAAPGQVAPEQWGGYLGRKVMEPGMIGAEVRGVVDGAFSSGYLLTATVRGQLLRGVLFSPMLSVASSDFAPRISTSFPTSRKLPGSAGLGLNVPPPPGWAFPMPYQQAPPGAAYMSMMGRGESRRMEPLLSDGANTPGLGAPMSASTAQEMARIMRDLHSAQQARSAVATTGQRPGGQSTATANAGQRRPS